MANFNTENPDQLIYSNSILTIEILGGVRLEGLDRMRVTLKVSLNESEIPPVRHNLDLYNDTQLEKFIRKIAERLEVGTSVTAGTLAELTQALENYRLEQIKEQNHVNAQPIKPLTEKEKQTAIENLKHETLLEQTIQDLQASGIQGEAENALILLLAMTSRKTPDPISVICLARSGVGKSYLMERVAMCMPDEDKKEHTQFTSNAFYYYKKEEIRNKIFLIEDLEGAVAVMFPIRELQSKKRISKTITQKGRDGKLQTITLIVEGPVCVIACTTKESIYEDNANRSFLIYIDESKEQDERIMDYQRKKSAGKINTHEEQGTKNFLKNVQTILQPITVINPYAEHLKIPSETFKPRRTNAHYLQSIEAVTYYKQYQREQKSDQSTGEVFIETTLEDIAEANELMKEILLSKSDELTGACRNYFEKLKSHLEQTKEKTFTNRGIRSVMRLPGTTVRRYHLELLQNGYIKLQQDKKAAGYKYEVISYVEYKELQGKVISALDETLDRIRQADEPVVSQSQNGSPKVKKTNTVNPVSQQATKTGKREKKITV